LRVQRNGAKKICIPSDTFMPSKLSHQINDGGPFCEMEVALLFLSFG